MKILSQEKPKKVRVETMTQKPRKAGHCGNLSQAGHCGNLTHCGNIAR